MGRGQTHELQSLLSKHSFKVRNATSNSSMHPITHTTALSKLAVEPSFSGVCVLLLGKSADSLFERLPVTVLHVFFSQAPLRISLLLCCCPLASPETSAPAKESQFSSVRLWLISGTAVRTCRRIGMSQERGPDLKAASLPKSSGSMHTGRDA